MLKVNAGYCITVVVTGIRYCILLRWDGGKLVLLDNTHHDSGQQHILVIN